MRYWVYLLLFGILSTACTRKKKEDNNLIEFIPQDASVILQIQNLSNFKSDLKNCAYLTTFKKEGGSTLLEMPGGLLQEVDSDSSATLSLSQRDGKEVMVLATFRASTRFPEDTTLVTPLTSITVEGVSLTQYSRDSLQLYSMERGDVSLWSEDPELLARLANQRSQPTPALDQLLKTANGRTSATLYRKGAQDRFTRFFPFVEPESNRDSLAPTWQVMDINLEQAAVSGSGIVSHPDSLPSWGSLFRGTQPLENRLAALAPLDADALLSFTFDNYTQFVRNQQNFLGEGTLQEDLFSALESVGIIYLKGEEVVVLNMFDSAALEAFLGEDQTGSRQFQGSEILTLRNGDFLSIYFKPIISDFNALYVTRLENQFIFASSAKSLEAVLQAFNSGAVYELNPVYESSSRFRSREASLEFIADAKGMKALMDTPLFNESGLQESTPFPSGFAYSGQLVSGSDYYFNNMAVSRIGKPAMRYTTTEVFRLQLDAEVATKPQFVINHRNRKKEIVVQDAENKLYLISPEGKILWKKQLDSRVQGEIRQVDIYKNGRLQLAFTTNEQFLILDRNGKEVAPFNMSFKGGNLNPLAVFDYENNRNYRFVVSQGRKVFMYNSRGQIVKGYTYTEAEAPILRAPQHFRVGSKDYLVFQLENGSLEIRNRVGKTRIPVEQRFEFSENPVYLYRNQFTFTDNTGRLYTIDTKGKLSASRLNLDALHRIDATSKTLATLTENILTIKGRPITLDLGVYTAPKIFYLYDKIYVSVTDLQGEKVYLFDSQTNSIPGFPVFGVDAISLDDLDNDRDLELVTKGQGQDLILYRMN